MNAHITSGVSKKLRASRTTVESGELAKAPMTQY
jgi:hypothetical protein